MSIQSSFSKNFHKFHNDKNIFDLVDHAHSGEYVLQMEGDLYLFGANGLKIHKELMSELKSINNDYFTKMHEIQTLPLIMNYYSEESHEVKKKEHFIFLRQCLDRDFSRQLETYVSNYFDQLAENRSEDLIIDITKMVIRFHLDFFLKIDVTDQELLDLAYFEDHFTMGLHLHEDKLELYYGLERFKKASSTFSEVYERYLYKNKDYKFIDLNSFYSYSVAGSTNISKALFYCLKLVEETEVFADDFSVSLLIKELYRFLPLVDNQIVAPFICRYPTLNAKEFLESIGIKDIKGKIYIFHALNHADHTLYENPSIFSPSRWKDVRLSNSLATFGTGIHVCCGSRIVDSWLNSLLSNWYSRFYIKTEFNLLTEPFIYSVPHSQRLYTDMQFGFLSK